MNFRMNERACLVITGHEMSTPAPYVAFNKDMGRARGRGDGSVQAPYLLVNEGSLTCRTVCNADLLDRRTTRSIP